MLRASLHGFADGEGASGAIRTVSAAAESVVEEPPAHSPVPPLAERPFWSVMIPIYNCREDYLRETLGSVLRQDPGVADMQIEVLDNCSTIGDPEAVVREMGGGRIAFHRQTHNLGIGGNFNACIERARGHWVHILHGDDTVRPDFYSRARAGVTAHPEVAAALCRILYMDEDSQWTGLTEPRVVQGALEGLTELGWLRPEAVRVRDGGRPTVLSRRRSRWGASIACCTS